MTINFRESLNKARKHILEISIFALIIIWGIYININPSANPLLQQQQSLDNYATHAHYIPAESTCIAGFIVCTQWSYSPAHVEPPAILPLSDNGQTCNDSNSWCGSYQGFNQSVMPK